MNIIFSHKYLIGQLVLFKNTKSHNLKSVLCPDCRGYGEIGIKNSIEKLKCKKCSGYGYKAMHYSNAKYNEFDKLSLGYIKSISINKDGLISYSIEPAPISEYNFRNLTKMQVLNFYDVPNKVNFTTIYNVNQGDIKEVYKSSNNIDIKQKYISYKKNIINKPLWFQFKDIFDIGDKVYCAYQTEIPKEQFCDLCKNTKKITLNNGKIIDCKCKVFRPKYEKIVRLLEGKILSIYYDVRLENEQFNNEVVVKKCFKLELKTPYLKNCNSMEVTFTEQNICFSKSIDEALIYCEKLEQKL